MTERWLSLPDFPGYEISDLGNIRGRSGQILRLQYGGWKRKYQFVNLCGQRKAVSRLVLITFRGIDPDRPEARHLNGVHDDNRLDNLAWGTHSENIRDQRNHGTWWRTGRQKLLPEDVDEIRELAASGMTQVAIAKLKGIRQPQVSRILNGKTWAFDPRPQ